MKLINNGSLTSGLLVCTKGKVAARALFKSRKEMKFGSCNYHAEPKTTAVANRKEGAAAMVTTPGRPNNEQNRAWEEDVRGMPMRAERSDEASLFEDARRMKMLIKIE